MIDDVEDRGDEAERGVEPDQQSDQPEVADGRVGQQSLEILLEDRGIRAEHERDEAGRPHEP